jgi:hypothetical protein
VQGEDNKRLRDQLEAMIEASKRAAAETGKSYRKKKSSTTFIGKKSNS